MATEGTPEVLSIDGSGSQRHSPGRTAEEIVIDDSAGLAWIVNLGCIELHPHPVRSTDLDHPDELRVDLDPGPGVEWADVRRVALEVNAVLGELAPRWTFTEVRRAALALSREVERRAPSIATSKWWKEERHGVFLDYNQNAKDRTTCSAYSAPHHRQFVRQRGRAPGPRAMENQAPRRRSHPRHAQTRGHRPVLKISASSWGTATSSCAKVQSAGFLSIRQRRNCAV